MAGGESRRMGRDKAKVEWGGQTLLDRMIDASLEVTESVAVVGRTGEREGILWLEDDSPHLGPLGGLKTALAHLDGPALVVACDMPKVDRAALNWLVDHFCDLELPAHGLVTMREGHLEPLFSVYTAGALPLIEEHIAASRLSMRGLIKAGDFHRLDAPPDIAARLANINTPGELDGLRDGDKKHAP